LLIQSSAYGASSFPRRAYNLNLGAKPYWPVYAEAVDWAVLWSFTGAATGTWVWDDDVSTGANALVILCRSRSALAEMVFNNLFERSPAFG